MLLQIEGSQAVARTVALCRPEVICAYPITPQTHIVEALGVLVRRGDLAPCEFINVESEFAAMSVAIGASAAGARAYTATASQGLLYMTEAVYNAAGLGLPIVMTVANRAIGAPINIWNDHSDSMALRDAGWIQLHARDNQEAADLHVQAFRLAEELSVPVMVCMDGFVLTHAFERVEIPSQEQVDSFLPPFVPRQSVDPDDPVSIGAMVGPEAFTEVRYVAARRFDLALDRIPAISADFEASFGREAGGLVHAYHPRSRTVVLTLGSVVGTVLDVVDEARAEGAPLGVVSLMTYRPFPAAALAAAVAGAERVVVIEKAFAPGSAPMLSTDVRLALGPTGVPCHSVVAGLGGRPIRAASLRPLLERALAGELPSEVFLDLDQRVAERELARAERKRSGPSAENILRDLAAGGAPND